MRSPSLPPPPPVTASLGIERTESANTVAAYLKDMTDGGPWGSGPNFSWSDDPGMALFTSPPSVRFSADTPDDFRNLTIRAVDAINAWLPYEQHITIGSDVSRSTYNRLPPTGDIYVGLGRVRGGGRPDADGGADIDVSKVFDSAQNRWEKREILASRVWMTPNQEGLSESHVFSTIVHELLHTLGLHGHVEREKYPETVMGADYLRLVNGVPEIDGVALLAAYTQLESGAEPEDLTADSLGSWSNQKTVFAGTLQACQCGDFGTDWINGYAVPWANGQVTTGTFAGSGLSGTATWTGQFVGFTPDKRAVSGHSTIAVNIGTLDGNADFTGMQFYEGGAQWDDGDLGYTLTLDGNYFRSTGGDPGYTSGHFVGTRHDGAVGIVEHPDLTGAFGATR